MPVSEVEIRIGDERWRYWEHVTLQRAVDNFSTVTFTGPFDPSRAEMREALKPYQYQDLSVSVDGDDVLTGTMLTPLPKTEADKRTVQIDGYAKPAVIMDSNLPAGAFPIEWSGLTLDQIARSICQALGIELQIDGATGPAFKQVKFDPAQSPGPQLAELAKQRSKVLRDTTDGKLLITDSAITGRPVATLEEGKAPVLDVAVTFSQQDYFSEITGLVKSKPGRRGAKHTRANPHLSSVVRPFNFAANDIDKGALPSAVDAQLARMFGNMVGYVVRVPTWQDPSGNLWTPDTTVVLKAPGAMVYDFYELLVRNVILEQDGDSETAALGLVLPGSFSGEIPAVMPWD